MTHVPETAAINRPHFFPAPVSGTCVMQIWRRIRLVGLPGYQITAPIRTLFYSKPESGVHVTEMNIL